MFGAKAQSNGSDGPILRDIFKSVVELPTVGAESPRFKKYLTKLDYILLKLDTATGQVWMVQFGMGEKSSRRQVEVDNTSPFNRDEPEINGRFELYPTNNMYNFIMIDT